MKAGFGSSGLEHTWESPHPPVDEVGAHALVVIDDGGTPAAIVTSDLPLMWRSVAFRLRAAVAAAIGADVHRVGILCTQNHGGPFVRWDAPCDLDALDAAFADAAREALVAARPARVAYVEAEPSPPGLVNRRKRVEGLGVFTFWYGYDVREDGTAGCASLLEASLRGLATTEEIAPKRFEQACASAAEPKVAIPALPADCTFDGPIDGLVQGLFFRTPDGEPIGSLARWAAHPVAGTGLSAAPGGDYPVYIRRALAAAFGGKSLFLTGPCGNQCPVVGEKSVELARRTGETVAGHLVSELPHAEWEADPTVAAATGRIELPFRTDAPRSQGEADCRFAEARAALTQRREAGAPMREIKAMADRVEMLSYFAEGHETLWTGVTFDELAGGKTTVEPFALRVGRSVVLGMPSEPFATYSRRLRAEFDGPVITAEECNGYLSYIPTADEYPLGGYEVCAALVGPEADEVLTGGVGELVRKVMR